MYASWIKDEEEKHEFTKEYSTYIGSFSNPEAAKKIIEGPTVEVSEEEAEANARRILEEAEAERDIQEKEKEMMEKLAKSKHRRRRRKILKSSQLR